MRIAPPQVYSSVDVRNMLVPKTYELRKVSSVVMNHSYRLDIMSTKFKDVKSTEQNVNEVKTKNGATDVYQKNYINVGQQTDDTNNLTSATDFQTINDEVKLVKVCKKCHKIWYYDDFVWDQQVKNKMIKTIMQISTKC